MAEYINSKKSISRNDDNSYLASVSDLMSVLLFIFIVAIFIFVINFKEETRQLQDIQNELEKEKIRASEQLQQLKNTQYELENEKRLASEQLQQLKATQKDLTDGREIRSVLMQDIETSLLKYGIKVQIDHDKGILHLPEDILFSSGQAVLSPKGIDSLQKLGNILAEKLPCYSGEKNDLAPAICKNGFFPGRIDALLIEGHTDSIPISGRFEDNWHLSATRSLTTFRFLRVQLASLVSLSNAQNEPFLGVSAYGETRPVQSNETLDGRAANRRIDIRFVLAVPDVQ